VQTWRSIDVVELGSLSVSARSFEIKHPGTGANIGLRIVIQPSWSESVRRAVHENSARLMLASREGREQTFEEREASNFAYFAALIVGWDWYDATLDGEKPQLTADTLRNVLARFPWMQQQIDREAGNDKDFFTH
jgi:hypothetical protein